LSNSMKTNDTGRSRAPRVQSGFSLLEVLVAVAILAFCFLPIITHSRSTIRETEVSQEDLIARHYLIDLVERFKSSSLDELKELKTNAAYLQKDALLTDHARVAKEMERFAQRTGKVDQGLKGMQNYLDIAAMMNLIPVVDFQEDVSTGGSSKVHKLTLAVKWSSKIRTGERRMGVTKILAAQ